LPEPEEHPVTRTSRGFLPLRGLAATAVAALIPAIAGCEAGLNAPTQQWHQPTAGASAVVSNTLRINNVFILGPAPGFALTPGKSAGLYMALNNSGARDQLVSISAPDAAKTVQVPVAGLSIGRDQSLLLTGPAPRLVLRHLTRTLRGGQFVRVNMDFQSAGRVSLLVPVMPRAAFYATYAPAPPLLILKSSASPSPLAPASPTPTPSP
jgi:hypothetical protein